MSPNISIVIPCYNAEKVIGPTIDGVLSQTHSGFELIVVDDGSKDRTAVVLSDLAARDSRVRVVEQANAGVARARNSGYRACSADAPYVLFLDADDVLAPTALATLHRRLELQPDLVGAFGQCSRIDERGAQIAPAPPVLAAFVVDAGGVQVCDNPERLGFWHFLPVTPISTPGQCLLRKSALPREPFDPACVPCEDWDLWLCLTRSGEIGVENAEVLAYRDHVASASKNYRRMQEQRARVYRKHLASARAEELGRFEAAVKFGMYTFDAGLCAEWAEQALMQRRWLDALRLTVRSMRYRVRSLRSGLRGLSHLAAD